MFRGLRKVLDTAKSVAGGDGNYHVTIETSGSHGNAGSNAQICIKLIGENNEVTDWHVLDNFFKNDFKCGAKDVFHLNAKDVGHPLFIRFEIRGLIKGDSWACDEVVVSYLGVDTAFPLYDWVEKEVTICRGSAFTYAHADYQLRSVRSTEVDHTRSKFDWAARPNEGDLGWGIPRHADSDSSSELPKILKMTDARSKSFVGTALDGIANAAVTTIKSIFTGGLDDLDDFKKLYGHQNDPPFINRWDNDVEFGRQQIMGITPLALKRCYSLPDGCLIDNSVVNGFLNGKSLVDEMQTGRIFIGDYSKVFHGVIRNKNLAGQILYCPDAIGLFRVNRDNDLVPIAIQLVLDDRNTIFTPEDDYYDWLLAKMFYRTAAANLHEWHYHFFLTHNVMETFAVSLFRCFPRSHPLYKLLRPHLQTVSAINLRARQLLIGPGSAANTAIATLGVDCARKTFLDFNMKDLLIPEILKERGLDDPKVLPKNYFRDDAVKLWNIIIEFVTSILRVYYHCDDDVTNDDELQAFAKDVATEGLGWTDGNTRGMAPEIHEFEELVKLCTTLIFTCSANHASVNFPQYQAYQYIPNAPLGMRLPPHKKGEATLKRIMDTLPDLKMAQIQIAMTYTLSQYSPDEVYLGEYPMRLFTDKSALEAMEQYRSNLEKYSNEIKERNKSAGCDAYDWLLPSKVPNSIAV